MLWPTITTTGPCPHCGGDGTLDTPSGGAFDRHAEQWYPTHTTTPCRDCSGTGEALTTHCLMCAQLESDCMCSEDDLDAWNALEVAA